MSTRVLCCGAKIYTCIFLSDAVSEKTTHFFADQKAHLLLSMLVHLISLMVIVGEKFFPTKQAKKLIQVDALNLSL